MVSHTFDRALYTGIICLLAGNLFAQGKHDYRKSADNFFAKGDYYSAALYYEKFVDSKNKDVNTGYKPYVTQLKDVKNDKETSGKEQSVYRIAESYRHLKDYVNAEKWYRECLKLDSTQFPLLRLWLGTCLRANDNYTEAFSQLSQFLDSYKTEDAFAEKAKLELANCSFIEAQLIASQPPRFEIKKLEGGLNQANSNYAPSLLLGQWLVFTSTRTDSGLLNQKNTNPHKNGLYQVAVTEVSSRAVKFNLAELAGLEQGTSSFTADGKKMFFTRWTVEQGKKNAAVYYSQQESGKWSEPVKLGTAVNQEGYSSQQPFVSADGTQLLFSSDRPGGSGGFDIWTVPLDASGSTGTPSNLGKRINTPGDEQAPFYHSPSRSLVFASNGRVGMGGFDLYSAGGDFIDWSTPENAGFPINSVKDDIYFAATGSRSVWEEGYVSTDRNTACCLEIFRFKKIKSKKQITGFVLDCDTKMPVAGAAIRVTDPAENGRVILLKSNTSGAYHFELPEHSALEITAEKARYTSASLSAKEPADLDVDGILLPTICLTPVVEKDTLGWSRPRNVYFDFNRSDLRASEKKVLDSVVQILKNNEVLTLDMFGYTDGKGSDDYNQKLSDARVKNCYAYLVAQGIEPQRLIIKGNGECCPVEAEQSGDGKDNPAAREKNRRVEFRITGY